MSYQKPKLVGFTISSREENFIERAPPSSVHTRKKERVDMSDVNWMMEDDPTRNNENISYLARGTNPMQDVSYNNYGGGSSTSTIPVIQASNPYKISVVRPPLYPMRDLQPLSRQKYGAYKVQTNPGTRGMFSSNLEESVDQKLVNFSLKPSLLFSARPTAVYRMELPTEIFTRNAITDDRLTVRAPSRPGLPYTQDMVTDKTNPWEATREILRTRPGTNPNNPLAIENRNEEINIDAYIKKILVGKIDPNFHIVIHNPNNQNFSEVAGSIKDKLNIAVQSSIGAPITLTTEDGQFIKLKDYRWKIVQSAVGGDSLVLNAVSNPDLQLDRNTPLYSVGSSASGLTNDNNMRMNENEIDLRSKLMTSAGPTVSKPYGSGRNETVFDSERNILLRRQGNYGSFGNFGSIPQLINRPIPELSTEKSDIEHNIRKSGNRFNQY